MLLLAMTRLIREKWISSALLIAIAMVASLLIGEIFAAGEVAWIMALGALLEDWTVERAKKGLRNLINLTPQTGRRIVDGKEEMISVDEIKIGDILRILPGESVPVDGEIIQGSSSLDQSIMTGESLPIDKEIGDEVFCGTMNLYGAIDIKATSLGENSSLQKLIDLVKAADEKDCSVYISIPFCPTRCSYCSFVSYTSPKLLQLIPEYLEHLLLDMEYIQQLQKNYKKVVHKFKQD